MKRIWILVLVLLLLLGGCQSQKAAEAPMEEPKETLQEPPQEGEVQDETPVDVETKSEVKPLEPEEKSTGLRIEVLKGERRFLNAFMEITEIDKNESFLDLPKVLGPENLQGFVMQNLEEDFYKEAVDHWKEIIRVQDEKIRDDAYEFMTVYQVRTNVFESEEYLLLLARRHMVFGYDDVSDDSKVFCINKKTGDFVDSKEQMISQGVTVEEAMETLSAFQKEHSDVNPQELSDEIKAKLIQGDLETQQSLTQTYGGGNTIIINNFTSPEAYDKTQAFLIKDQNKIYLAAKLDVVELGEPMNHKFLHSYWMRIPAEYREGKLMKAPDPQELVDTIYE